MVETEKAKAPETAPAKAKVYMSGRSQSVRLPAAFRFTAKEVSIRREPNGDIVLSQAPDWDEIFAALDAAGFPDNFMADREQGLSQEREEI